LLNIGQIPSKDRIVGPNSFNGHSIKHGHVSFRFFFFLLLLHIFEIIEICIISDKKTAPTTLKKQKTNI